MLVGQIIQKNRGRPGPIPVYNERTCSLCRHWDLEHVQRSEFDGEAIPHREFFARCVNLKSPSEGRYMEAEDGCGGFGPR